MATHTLSDTLTGRLKEAVASATAQFRPSVTPEILETPEGIALHIKVLVDPLPNEEVRRRVVALAVEATLDAWPDLPMPPFVTVIQRHRVE